MGWFSKKEKLSITYSRGTYNINNAWHDNEKYHSNLYSLVQYFINKDYKSGDVLNYISRYFAEVFDVEVIVNNQNEVLFTDSDGQDVSGDDKLFIVSISVAGPTIKEIKAFEYLENWRTFQLLKKLDIVLYVSKNLDNCTEKMLSFREIWSATKK